MARIEAICPKLKSGEWTFDNDELFFQLESGDRAGPFTPEAAQISKFLNGTYSLQEAFLALIKQGMTFSFTFALETLYRMAQESLFENNEPLINSYNDLIKNKTEARKPTIELSESNFTKERIVSYIKQSCLIPPGDDEAAEMILNHSRLVACKKGNVLIAQGSEGKEVCLLMNGKLDVYREEFGNKRFIAHIEPVSIFGESPAFFNKKRNAEVLAAQNSWVLAVNINELLNDSEALKIPSVQAVRTRLFVHQVLICAPLFHNLPKEVVNQFINHCKIMTFKSNQTIIKQGDMGSEFYFTLKGRLNVERSGVKVAHLGRGDYFGEIGALTKAPRTANVTTIEETTVLSLELEHLGPILSKNFRLALDIEKTALERLTETAELSHSQKAKSELEKNIRDYSLSDVSIDDIDFSTFTGNLGSIEETGS